MNIQMIRSFAIVACACWPMAQSAQAVPTPPSLAPYYTYHPVPGTYEAIDPPIIGFPPTVRVVGGGVDPAPIVTSAGSFATVQRMLRAIWNGTTGIAFNMSLLERRNGACQSDRFRGSTTPIPRISGEQYTVAVTVDLPEQGVCPTDFFGG